MLLVRRCSSFLPTLRTNLVSYTASSTRHTSTHARNKLLSVHEEVEHALQTGKPVVALETTIYTHGFPYPENIALASHLESLVRVNGGVPATIGILDGIARVGLETEELIRLISTEGSRDTWKVSRRDLGFIGGLGGLRGQKLNGGTTISGTMILAHLAGIKIFATGGLGGVHRGGENSMDISADLTELGRTPVCVVSSGSKSFLDIPRTLEYLETQGVGVGTFADGREGDVDFPAFFSRDSGVKSPQTIQNEQDAAAIVHAQFSLPVQSGLLFANPVPVEAAMKKEEIDGIIATAVREAHEMGIKGAKNTPYVLKRIRELSNNASVTANKALIEANVVRGTKVAVELCKLEKQDKENGAHGALQFAISASSPPTSYSAPATSEAEARLATQARHRKENDILVIGALAADTSCDYSPFNATTTEILPTLHTSNPASISQSAGGVGRNVATAAQYAGAQVSLASVVADDLAGKTLIRDLASSGVDTESLRVLDPATGARTAQYVAINDKTKDLMLAMGDFSIFSYPEFEQPEHWSNLIASQNPKPKWIVIDGNWSTSIILNILLAAKACQIPVAFEPVSTVKAARLFHRTNMAGTAKSAAVVPDNLVSLVTPNEIELASMHEAAQESQLFESEAWWQTIDSFGLSSSGSRDKFVMMAGAKLADNGVPQQIIRLLPFVPNVVTKLGAQGCLLAMLLRREDPRLTSPESAPYILSRTKYESGPIGGVYMRLFPPAEVVGQDDIVSVNGVGDTMLGVVMAGTIAAMNANRRVRLEEIVPVAQRAAVSTLKSRDSDLRLKTNLSRTLHQENPAETVYDYNAELDSFESLLS